MIKIENYLGGVYVSRRFLVNLVGTAVTNCFGVAGMAVSGPKQGILDYFYGNVNTLDRGIIIKTHRKKLKIELHIIVVYGMNISVVVKSIVNKVRYVVEEVTGIPVEGVNVYVDGLKEE